VRTGHCERRRAAAVQRLAGIAVLLAEREPQERCFGLDRLEIDTECGSLA